MIAQHVPVCHSPWTLPTLTRRLAAPAAAATGTVAATSTQCNSRWHFRFQQNLNACEKRYKQIFSFRISLCAVQRYFAALLCYCVSCSSFCYSVRFGYIYCSSWLTALSVFVLSSRSTHSLYCYFITTALRNRTVLLFSIPANAYKFSIFCSCSAHVRRRVWREAVTRSALNKTKIDGALHVCRAQVSCQLLRFSPPFLFCLIRWLYAPTTSLSTSTEW